MHTANKNNLVNVGRPMRKMTLTFDR